MEFGIFQNTLKNGWGLLNFLSELNEKINFTQERAYNSSTEQHFTRLHLYFIFIVYGLFGNAVRNSDYIVPMIWLSVNNELDRMCK
jgi:hypothetical protein